MKKLILIFVLGWFVQAQAATINPGDPDLTFTSFTDGDGLGINWTASFGGGNGQVDYDDGGAGPVSITGDVGVLAGVRTSIETGSVQTGGLLSFNWDFSTLDSAFTDPFFFILDSEMQLTDSFGLATQSGSETNLAVSAGSIFGFAIDTFIVGGGAPGIGNISALTFTGGFSAGNPDPVPVPPAFLLFGTALAGLGFLRKRKQLGAA